MQLKNISNLINSNQKIILQKFEQILPELIKTQWFPRRETATNT
jgi:hypothetical protein